jgi:ABC-type transport system involved in cytochrome c biogenesis permease subunit
MLLIVYHEAIGKLARGMTVQKSLRLLIPICLMMRGFALLLGSF